MSGGWDSGVPGPATLAAARRADSHSQGSAFTQTPKLLAVPSLVSPRPQEHLGDP